jgi:methylmalonyl-CoA mutase cobalamin-binding domain/chain
MEMDKKRQLIDSMRDLDELKVLQYTVELTADGVSSYEVFEALLEGIRAVDALYEAGRYFIADLIMAGHILKSVMSKVLVFHDFGEYKSFGRVVIATVKDDIHDLGKNVIADVLRYNGFEVSDLGVDVSSESIVKAVLEYAPNIVILSGTLSASAFRMGETISALEAAGLRGAVRIITGGAGVTAEIAGAMGADAFSSSVEDCLKLCHAFMALAAGEM